MRSEKYGKYQGFVEAGYVDKKTGLWLPGLPTRKNLIVFSGADILAKVLGGDSKYFASHMYFEFINDAEGAGQVPPATPSVVPESADSHAYYEGLDGDGYDFMRVPIDSTPVWTASDSNYSHNTVRFLSVCNAVEGHFGNEYSQSAGSIVFGGALVAAPTGAFDGDIIFSRFYFDVGLIKIDNAEIALKWGVQFN